jgi:PAS domain S-box-containing protein
MRLVWQVCLLCLACVLLPTTVLTGVLSYREAKYSYAQLREEQRLLAVTISSQVESGYHEQIWPFEMLWAVAKKSEFVFWQIADGDGRTVLAHGAVDPTVPMGARALKEPLWTVSSDGAAEEWIVPLAIGSVAKPWTYRLGFRADEVRDHIRRIILTNTLVAAATSVLLVGASFFLARRLVEPMRSLTLAATELKRGNLDVSLPRASNDEMRQLVAAFHSMTMSIRERDLEIKDHLESLEGSRAELEVRVQERTSELVKAKSRVEAASASLQENEARMRAIIEHAADGIVTVSDTGTIEVFNPTACKIFGYEQGDLTGENISFLFAWNYGIDFEGQIVDRSGEEPIRLGRSAEVACRRKSGQVFPLQIALSEMRVGTRRLFTAVLRDISERRRVEDERREMNERLVLASRSAGMAEVATSVLHNVGNVLTSVNVSATMLMEAARESKVGGLGRAAALMQANAANLGEFVTTDPSGKLLPEYLKELSIALEAEQAAALQELEGLIANVNHIKAVVKMQQTYARKGKDVAEDVSLQEIVRDALRIGGRELEGHAVELECDYAQMRPICVDRHKVIQILVNLITNAMQALEGRATDRRLSVETCSLSDGQVSVRVSDNGVGISRENLVKIFNHGFTTKEEGHGFGLHSSAVSAMELGGTLVAESDGPGRGAAFVLTLPSRPETPSSLSGVYEHAV